MVDRDILPNQPPLRTIVPQGFDWSDGDFREAGSPAPDDGNDFVEDAFRGVLLQTASSARLVNWSSASGFASASLFFTSRP